MDGSQKTVKERAISEVRINRMRVKALNLEKRLISKIGKRKAIIEKIADVKRNAAGSYSKGLTLLEMKERELTLHVERLEKRLALHNERHLSYIDKNRELFLKRNAL